MNGRVIDIQSGDSLTPDLPTTELAVVAAVQSANLRKPVQVQHKCMACGDYYCPDLLQGNTPGYCSEGCFTSGG